MTKILRKYTTIPDHLYIHRNADNQLRQIIEEMDRPGYVLVARQMGKTNLLFNVKRELEDENTLFTYIDLSNVFDEERECYRNIIDTILESNQNKFGNIASIIKQDRKELIIPPHKEHISELRKLLNNFDGKIVIILDEIDALRAATYSDKIFAQIRSNYFARTTFPEFENLTYILSGVIEPTELIKDRNKSPFNIGEKIYIDDFTFEEHCSFILKSKLSISSEISQEIYNWTTGNPRLTFDICSSIEDWIIEKGNISKEDVISLIKNKYLVTFDIAPIDHIRELVANNSTVRNAITNIKRGVNNISTEIKSKLYLYGIINSDFENIKIKNKIIDLSLSEEWLITIEKQSKSLFELGSEWILKSIDIDGGISVLRDYLDSDLNIPNANKQLSHYYIGYGYHLKRLYAESNKFLKKQIISQDISTDLHYRQKLFIGLNHYNLKEFDDGEKYLMEIITDYKNSPPYLNALLNLATRLIERDFKQNNERAKSLLEELILNADIIELDKSDKLTINEFKTLAFYYISEICFRSQDLEETIKNIDLALKYADIAYVPQLLFTKYTITSNDSNDNILSQIVDVIIQNKITIENQQNSEISFSERNVFNYLLVLYSNGNIELFQKLFLYTCNSLYKNRRQEWEVYHDLALFSDDAKITMEFHINVLEFETEISDPNIIYKTYRSLSLESIENDNRFKKYFEKFLTLFSNSENNIEMLDISVFARAIKFHSDKRNINKGIEICDIIEPRLNNLQGDLEFESLIIYYWYSNLYFSLKNIEKAVVNANKTLNLINKYKDKNKRGSLIDEKGIKIILEQMHQIKNSIVNHTPRETGKQFGRNDIIRVLYIDGKEIKAKYKKLEADILAERCKIIND